MKFIIGFCISVMTMVIVAPGAPYQPEYRYLYYWGEESIAITSTANYPFSLGNGFIGTSGSRGWGFEAPYDGHIVWFGFGTHDACSGGASVEFQVNGSSVSRTVSIPAGGDQATGAEFEEPVNAGDIITFKLTSACTSGGAGAVPRLVYRFIQP